MVDPHILVEGFGRKPKTAAQSRRQIFGEVATRRLEVKTKYKAYDIEYLSDNII